MRTLSEAFKRKLQAGEIPELVLRINEVDYSEAIIDPHKIRLDRNIDNSLTIKPQDLVINLYDPDGSIEAVLNDEPLSLTLGIRFGSETVIIFQGYTQPDQFHREGKVLTIRAVDKRKKFDGGVITEDDNFFFWKDCLHVRGIRNWLLTLFPDSDPADIPFMVREFDPAENKTAFSYLESYRPLLTEPNPFQIDDIGNYITFQDGAYTGIVFVSNMKLYHFRIVEDVEYYLAIERLSAHQTIDLSSYGSAFRIVGIKSGRVYIAGKEIDNDINLFEVNLSDGSINQWAHIDIYPPSLETIAFDHAREVFLCIRPPHPPSGNKWELWEYSNTTTEKVWDDEVYPRPSRVFGTRSYDNSKYVLLMDIGAGVLLKLEYSGSWGNFGTISGNIFISTATTAYYADGYCKVILRRGLYLTEYQIEDGSLTDLPYLAPTGERYIQAQRLVNSRDMFRSGECYIMGRDNNWGGSIWKLPGGQQLFTGGFPCCSAFQLKIFPFYWGVNGEQNDLLLLYIIKVTYEEVTKLNLGIALLSNHQRVPYFIWHPRLSTLNITKKQILDWAEFFGNLFIDVVGDTVIKACDRCLDCPDPEVLDWDNYEVNPEQRYQRWASSYRIKDYYRGGQWMTFGSQDGHTISIDCPLVDLNAIITTASWYLNTMGSGVYFVRLKTNNLFHLENFDCIRFYDPIYRWQTGRIIATSYKYPLGYEIAVIGRINEVQTPPPYPEPSPSAPDWEDVNVSLTRINQGIVENVKLTFHFRDTGGLPIERLHIYLRRNGFDPNGHGIVEDENIILPVPNPSPGTHFVNLFITASAFDDLDIQVYGTDRLGRATSIETFSFPGQEQVIFPQQANITVENIMTGVIFDALNLNPTFEDNDEDGAPEGWEYEPESGNFSLEKSGTFGGNVVKMIIPPGATYVVRSKEFIPVSQKAVWGEHDIILVGYTDYCPGSGYRIISIECYDADKNALTSVLLYPSCSLGYYWYLGHIRPEDLPEGTAYIKLSAQFTNDGTSDMTMKLDLFLIRRSISIANLQATDDLNMGGNRIVGLADPVNDSDAATKYYVDTTGGGGGGVIMPKYIYLKALGVSGNTALFDDTTWATSKAQIKLIRVETLSDNWTLTLYPNDNYDESGNVRPLVVIENASGNLDIHLDYSYHDETEQNKVYVNFTDNSGSHTADIWIIGFKLS